MNYWSAPGGDSLDLFDFRALPQQALFAGQDAPEGYGLFVYDGPRNHSELVLDLGSDVEAGLSLAQRSGIEALLGQRVASVSMDEIYPELIYTHGDPTGQNRWKPKRAGRKTDIKLSLGPWKNLVNQKFSESHPAYENTVDVFRADYRRNKAEGARLQDLQRFTGTEQKKLFGRMGDDLNDLLPPEYVKDGWKPSNTQYGDDFTGNGAMTGRTATGTGSGWTWTELTATGDTSGGEFVATDSCVERAGHTALASDDHDAEIDFTAAGTNNSHAMGICARFSGSAATYYVCWATIRAVTGGTHLYKRVAGSYTSLDNQLNSTQTAPINVRISCTSDDSITGYLDDVQDCQATTETSITGNFQTGLDCLGLGASGQKGDNFFVDDFAASGHIMASLVGAGGLAGAGGIAGRGGGLAG